ncbi:hypothetical protein A8709_16820 [Paenibacillus pectinilyticus]|uniref:Tissue inhibitor of metalloproteinase n=1 Tax=Paenibacillus pectinilyticus TaxID=512399 RepID=A0A1C1A8L1_9BACL|nr:hypothetical protein A8709_16820 [Paenibacillus pectinilyticus]
MKKGLIFLTFMMLCSCLSMAVPNKTYACSCMKPPDPIKAVAQSKAVFSGTVLDIKRQVLDIDGIIEQQIAVLFDVEQTWKGLNQTQVMVLTNLDEPACGYHFQVGQTYLVFAGSYNYNKELLGTSNCSLTKGISVAAADLNQIGQGEKPTEIVSLQHKMDRMAYTNRWAYVTMIVHRIIHHHLDELMVVGGILVAGGFILVLLIRKRRGL